jgi:Restriction endonuclease EcoRI.
MPNQKLKLRTRLTKNLITGRNSFIDISSKQEQDLLLAVNDVIIKIFQQEDFSSLNLTHKKSIVLNDIIKNLKERYSNTSFSTCFNSSTMKPDGGLLYLIDHQENMYPILIAEKKNQGTNDLREEEGLKKQAKGNAIERLGKNVIGLKTYTMKWDIFPFVCFGDGCDFAEGSSIIDRVKTMAMYGNLNEESIFPTDNSFLRGTFYFRARKWSRSEMFEKCYSIAEKSIYHFFARYGKQNFVN